MKKLIVISTIILGFAFNVSAQQLKVKTYMEYTSVSPKLGTAVGWKSDFGIEYGGFYQESGVMESLMLSAEEKSNLPRFYEKVFYGMYFNFPVTSSKRFDLDFNVRTGVVNKLYFAITPSFLGSFKINRNISVGTGVGIRSFRPTLQTNISITL